MEGGGQMEVYDKDSLEKYLGELRKVFDVVRVVEPMRNKIHFLDGREKIEDVVNCYDFWENGKICDNCVSANSIMEDRRSTKIEYNESGVYLVVATPFILDGNKYSIEMILNINDIDTILDLNKENTRMIEGVITNLKEELLVDDLTGIYNRRFINRNLPLEIELIRTNKLDKAAVIMLDIDDFKEINDIYGHLVGDNALKEIAATISANIRKESDWVARYGGDEFIILLKNADEKIAKKVIKSIEREINNKIIIDSNPQVKITASIGIHIVDLANLDYEEIIKLVDKKLNMAKISGKNRIISS